MTIFVLICRDMRKSSHREVHVGRPFTKVKMDRTGNRDSPWGRLFRESLRLK